MPRTTGSATVRESNSALKHKYKTLQLCQNKNEISDSVENRSVTEGLQLVWPGQPFSVVSGLQVIKQAGSCRKVIPGSRLPVCVRIKLLNQVDVARLLS